MARRKQLDKESIVQKSRPLSALWQSELNLIEFKILDVYLSKINSHSPEQRRVNFEKGELERLFDVDRIRTDELRGHLKKLMSPIELSSSQNDLHLMTLFEEARCEKDSQGIWQIRLECTQKAMKYFFNVENLGYLRYKLKCITGLQSRYSYVLFVYVEANRFKKEWTVSVSELREILNCSDDNLYSQFKYLNNRILKRAYAELIKKTPCRFDYEPIRTGRAVTDVRFTVIDFPSIDEPISKEVPGQLDIFGKSDTLELWGGACNNEFSRAEMAQLAEVLRLIPSDKFSPYAVNDDIDLQRYHYLAEKYAAMKRVNEKKAVKNCFSYMLAILKADAGIKP